MLLFNSVLEDWTHTRLTELYSSIFVSHSSATVEALRNCISCPCYYFIFIIVKMLNVWNMFLFGLLSERHSMPVHQMPKMSKNSPTFIL